MNGRVDRISWQNLWVEMAKLVSKRSEDPHTQVGAVIVKDNKILSFGYNGSPNKFTYDFDWGTKEKYTYCIHAEANALVNAAYNGVKVEGADIYLTLSPCVECTKLLAQAGIKNVYYIDEYKDLETSKLIANNIKTITFTKVNINKIEE